MLDDIVNKYDNTVHRTIKIKPIDITSDSYAEYNEDPNKKDPKVKIVSKYENTKTFLLKEFLLLVKLKTQFHGFVLLVTWMVNQLLEIFMKENCKKQIKKNSEQKK